MTGSLPDWLNHYGDATPVIDPESHMRELAGRGGGDAGALCPALVMGGFIDPMVDPMAEATGAVDSNLKPNLRIGDLDGQRVGVANVPVGASHATTIVGRTDRPRRAHISDCRRHRRPAGRGLTSATT